MLSKLYVIKYIQVRCENILISVKKCVEDEEYYTSLYFNFSLKFRERS